MARDTESWRIPAGHGDREQRSKVGDGLLQLGLAHHTGTAPTDWLIGRSANGGPIVRQSKNPEHELRISLSHSGQYFVAAVCNGATIGIDIERCRERRFADIAHHLDWPRAVWQEDGTLGTERFYHAWTLWEAAIKACSDKSGQSAASVFGLILSGLAVGTPVHFLGQSWFARSWRYRDQFWLSIVAAAPKVPDIRLFQLNRLNSAPRTLRINEISSDNGHLDPEIFQPEESSPAGDER